jgi:hypothetical protein
MLGIWTTLRLFSKYNSKLFYSLAINNKLKITILPHKKNALKLDNYQNIGWRFNRSVVLLVCSVPYGNEDFRLQFSYIRKKFWYKIRLIYLYQKFLFDRKKQVLSTCCEATPHTCLILRNRLCKVREQWNWN